MTTSKYTSKTLPRAEMAEKAVKLFQFKNEHKRWDVQTALSLPKEQAEAVITWLACFRRTKPEDGKMYILALKGEADVELLWKQTYSDSQSQRLAKWKCN